MQRQLMEKYFQQLSISETRKKKKTNDWNAAHIPAQFTYNIYAGG